VRECPHNVSRTVSDSTSQSVTVPSRLVDTTVSPSGLKTNQLGAPPGALRAVRTPWAPRFDELDTDADADGGGVGVVADASV
jgi:hypothetical protein